MKEKGIGYWDIIKELYNGIVDTKPNGDSSTLKQIWDTTPIGQLQNIIMDNTNVGNKQKNNSKTTHVTKGILNHIKDTGNIITYKSSSMSEDTNRLITIENPEKLNTNDRLIAGEWGVTYGGRDLSIDEDNYGWIITNRVTGERGFYIVERELVQRDWLNVRWGNGDSKERKELIDKSRLANMGQIRRDMIKAVMNTK